MYRVFNSQDILIATTNNEAEAEMLAWINDGYYI